MTKSPWKNVTDVGIKLGAACIPRGHASDQAAPPSKKKKKVKENIAQTSVKLMSHLRKMTKLTKWKSDKNKLQDLIQTTCTFSNHGQKDVRSWIEIGIKLYKEFCLHGTHCLYTFIESEVRKWQSSQSGKSDKNKFKDYIQTTCTSPDHGENMCKVSKRSV